MKKLEPGVKVVCVYDGQWLDEHNVAAPGPSLNDKLTIRTVEAIARWASHSWLSFDERSDKWEDGRSRVWRSDLFRPIDDVDEMIERFATIVVDPDQTKVEELEETQAPS